MGVNQLVWFSRPKAPLAKTVHPLPNALKAATTSKRREREGSALSTSSQEESRKRKRSAQTGDKIKIDQAHLKTVIPAIGKPVMVVNGAYRGLRALLESLNTD